MSQIYVPTVSSTPSIPTQFNADTGFAVPVANQLDIVGSPGVRTTGSTNVITIILTNTITQYTDVIGPTTYDVVLDDYYISCNTFGGPVTIRLADTTTQYRTWVIKDRTGTSNTNSVFVTTVSGVVLIDGLTSYTFGDDYESLQVLWNGTSYETF